jgi:transposase-like protein
MRSFASQDVAKRSVPMTKLKYTPEIRERAFQLLIESEKDYPSTWAAITAIAPKIGCTPETLRAWHQRMYNLRH